MQLPIIYSSQLSDLNLPTLSYTALSTKVVNLNTEHIIENGISWMTGSSSEYVIQKETIMV